MKSNYYCSIHKNQLNKIYLFDLFDEKKELIYNGSGQIKDRVNMMQKEFFFGYYCYDEEKILIKINKQKFNLFLNLYYDEIKDTKIIDFLIKHKMEEYGI